MEKLTDAMVCEEVQKTVVKKVKDLCKEYKCTNLVGKKSGSKNYFQFECGDDVFILTINVICRQRYCKLETEICNRTNSKYHYSDKIMDYSSISEKDKILSEIDKRLSFLIEVCLTACCVEC